MGCFRKCLSFNHLSCFMLPINWCWFLLLGKFFFPAQTLCPRAVTEPPAATQKAGSVIVNWGTVFFRYIRSKLPRRYEYSACENLLGPTFGSMFCSWIFIQDAAALSWGDADAVHALCKKHFGTTHVAWQGRVNVATGSLLGTSWYCWMHFPNNHQIVVMFANSSLSLFLFAGKWGT